VRRAFLVLVAIAAVAAIGGIAYGRSDDDDHVARPVRAAVAKPKPHHRARTRPRSLVLAERRLPTLAAPVQDQATAAVGARVVLAGGLTPADTSSDAVATDSGSRERLLGRLPGAQHDAAAVALGDRVYVFGGGNGAAQLDHVLRVDPASGAVRDAGRLPVAASDVAAAAIGGTAYVVGGYTGTRWLDTIVAWRPGAPARVVGHLPTPLRYAAAAAADGQLVVAGGSTPSGSASRTVLAFDPATHHVRRLGRLPTPTTHAAAASLGGVAYVIGGRGATLDSPSSRIVAVDPVRRRIRPAGSLAAPLSDLGAATTRRGILVVGGRGLRGTVSTVGLLAAAARVDVYAHDQAGMLAAPVESDPPRVYVPNSGSGTVDVIDQRTFRIVDHFAVGALPQHITPAYDLGTLYVNDDEGNSLTPIDPRTGRPGKPIAVADPYNLYFTPGGRYAIVVAERLHRLDFRDARTFRLHRSLDVPCAGVNHMDFSADGRYAIVSCEFSGRLLKVDVRREKVLRVIHMPARESIPQDVRVEPDGRRFWVADLAAGGVWKVDGDRFRVTGFVHTGTGAHGLVVSRDAKLLYVANRNDGSVSVISFRTGRVVATWHIPGGGSPDMGAVSADGKVLWLSGRYNGVVYAIDTANGRLLAKVPVGAGPHGVAVWPQPGRYSLGHTGILR
jgi:DNA-binding beta-propeller fold protein YncE